MGLLRAEITDFRCLGRVDVVLDPAYTLISGSNASGKTSLLEAIYFLGRGRSFRTRHLEHLVRRQQDRLVVFGEAEAAGRRFGIGIEAGGETTRAHIGGSPINSLADLSLALPVQVIDPEVHKLIEEGPGRRRRYLDWGVFHVEPSFVNHWQRYQQALRQRNAALRGRLGRAGVQMWDSALIEHGQAIATARQRYLQTLGPVVVEFGRQLLGAEVSLSMRHGWPKDQELQEALQGHLALDEARGSTQMGPHRADLQIRIGGALARDFISRGQQKLLAAAMLLAQLLGFGDERGRASLLLDDPAAELDSDKLGDLIELVRSLPVQMVVTSLNPELPGLGLPGRRYTLQAGQIRPV